MFKLEDRGPMMIEPGCKVYKGMIVASTPATTTRDQHPQGQAAHQHPHHLEGRSVRLTRRSA